MDTLLGLMQNHRDIALSCNQRKNDGVIQFWKKVEQQLNAAGPPFKGISEWRKVWADQKKYVRNKAARNLDLQYKTDTEYRLSAYEAAVLDLVGSKKVPVDNVAVNKFVARPETKGQVDGTKKSEDASNLFIPVTPTSKSYEGHQKDLISLLKEKQEFDINTIYAASAFSKESTDKASASEIKENKSKAIQEKCFGSMSTTLAELKQEYTGVAASVVNIYQSLDKSNEYRKELLNETIRHNKEMEMMRQREIEMKVEKNRQLIKIETFKLKLLQKKE